MLVRYLIIIVIAGLGIVSVFETPRVLAALRWRLIDWKSSGVVSSMATKIGCRSGKAGREAVF